MSTSLPDLHVYERKIQASERTSLAVLAGHVPPGARVLDLGCGSGAFGRFLAERDGPASGPIDGLTLSTTEAQQAQPTYRRVLVANLDEADLSALFDAGGYDLILCADVLEHVQQRQAVLAQCRELLAPGGRLLLSIPNVAYSGLIAELMTGQFRYRDEGLLDRTHLHFFTRQTLLKLLADGRYAVEWLDTIERPLPASEFHVAFDALPPAVTRHLLALPDALTYQFVVIARPMAEHEAGSGTAPPAATTLAHAQFTAQLFVDIGAGYDEAHKLIAAGAMGQERQTLRFELPDQPQQALRLDPADRPGFLHLHGMRLLSSRGERLWHWTPEQADRLLDAPYHGLLAQPPVLSGGAFTLLLHDDDPWLVLPIPPHVLAQAGGGTLEIEAGWPMSADYLALAGVVQRLQHEWASGAAPAAAGKLEALGERFDALRIEHGSLQQERDRLLQLHDTLQARQRVADQVATDLRQRNQELIALTHHLNAERNEAFQVLRSIEQSNLFRLTRPLVHTKMWLDRRLRARNTHASAQTTAAPQPLPPAEHPVDIILPVYRGLHDTQLSVTSVLASSCRTPWRLIVINDASPEPEVTAWLRSACSGDPRIVLLENEQNLGFVGTVNRGMALSQHHDVLLLNSDTEVALDWLDRIRSAAYSDQRIASVTPFSNNATICSYPRFCQDNPLPAGWTTAELHALCARTNPGQVVDVPTGVGFCMYIRRAALAEVGLFDVEHFGKGYGEENDFCVRAARAGWRNLHALDAFVFHSGGVSFGASKSPSERAAMETMRRLHPHYEQEVMRFVQQDPAAAARAALDFARVAGRGVPLVLAITHNREGGTLQHVRQLARALRQQSGMLMLRPAPDQHVTLELAESDGAGTPLRFKLPEAFDALLNTLRALGVRHIHYHHLLGHHPLVRDQLTRALDVTHDFTVHDFLPVCPQISMIGPDGGYCGEQGLQQCAECLHKNPAPEHADILTWRAQHTALLERARYVIAPSRDALQRLHRYVPHAHHIHVPHLEDEPPEHATHPQPRQLSRHQRLKVAVIGALSVIKGADTLEDTALAARRASAPLDFHLVGYAYRALRTQPTANLTVHGAYQEHELEALLDWLQPDLVWFPARVPETYSYTLSTVLRHRLPVVAPDVGAFADRLSGRPWTWIEPWNRTASDWLAFFEQVHEQHFLTGQPPALPAAPTPLPPGYPSCSADWYRSDYLHQLPVAPPAELPRHLITQHLLRPAATSPAAVAGGLALSVLVRLRRLPWLAPMARRIPPGMQRRVKNWLLR